MPLGGLAVAAVALPVIVLTLPDGNGNAKTYAHVAAAQVRVTCN